MKSSMVKMAVFMLMAFAAVSCKHAPKYELTDGHWTMTAWLSDDGEEMVVTHNAPTMNFTPEMTVSGNAGCNQFMGTYEIDGEKITVNMGAMTMRMCDDMTVEDRMVSRMPVVTSFKIDGNRLTLLDGAGKELFRFDNAVEKEENR